MCSQPPKEQPDDHLLADAVELVRLLPQTTEGIGFTGGEPTLLGDGFFTLLRLCRNLLPSADVLILSNGRRFADPAFATAYAAVDNPRMMVGIPLYGPEPSTHDHVVQARNGFDETVRGILNLATLRQRIEVRVVLQRQTARVLVETAEFIARNLPFVDQVALMGLEIMGFARANLDQVWIDPIDYQEALAEATWLLHEAKLRVMIYNHQLCVLDASLWPFAVRSISDWKNEFHPECETCAVRPDCGGFFSSARHRRSRAIAAVQPASVGGTRASGRTDGVRSTNQPPRSAPRAAALPSR
jgi:His-Xaa-Ser system radical SAM maturase HxsC